MYINIGYVVSGCLEERAMARDEIDLFQTIIYGNCMTVSEGKRVMCVDLWLRLHL